MSPPLDLTRRRLLTSVGIAGTASLAGCSASEPAADGTTTTLSEERTRELAERYAPTLYFDEAEKWYPTDPRAYESEQDGETVVNGFDALNGYTEARNAAESPPDPTLFYHGVSYDDSPLAVVQFWHYSAFDQFTTNFHWHDWELLQVFVDTDTDEPQLYVASSHSRKVPNNEFLDPDPDTQPRILSELGSHSSALSINDIADRFQRLSAGGTLADITNSAIDTIEDVINLPIAYGLPRDEGSRLPYVVPELAGAPLYEHDRLPAVGREDLIAEELTVSSFSDLTSPPGELPARATGTVFRYAGREESAATTEERVDAEYELVSASEIEHISGFTGPQLSFEFAVPDFAEDAFAGHITTTGVPWEQPRYDDPATDISDRNHRATLADRYEVIGAPASASTVVASLSEAVSNDDAPENEGLTTDYLGIEGVALLESDPEAVPTFNGVAVIDNVPTGDHRLTVNGAGVEPHSETVSVDDDAETTPAGVEGSIPLVARENATKLEVDPEGADSDLTDLAVEDDFAGRLYDAPLSGADAVYVHRGGAYTAEVRDSDNEIGAERVNPTTDDGRVRLSEPKTGKASLATYLADVAEETRASVAAVEDGDSDDTDDDKDGDDSDDTNETTTSGGGSGGNNSLEGSENAVRGLRRALAAIVEAAQRAADRAADGDRGGADQSLANVQQRLERATTRLAEASDSLPDEIERASERRLQQSQRRSEQAQAAEKL